MVPSPLRHLPGHGTTHLPEMWGGPMSAHAYHRLVAQRKEKAFSYIDSRSRGIINFLRHRSQSLTLDRMIDEVRRTIPSATKKEATAT